MRIKTPIAAAALLMAAAQVWSADAATGTGVLTGHVNDPTGKSAANVSVRLVSKTTSTAKKPTTKPKDKPEAASGLTATTDENGDFTIEKIPAGQYTVIATMKGVGTSHSQINMLDGGKLDVKLQIVKARKKM